MIKRELKELKSSPVDLFFGRFQPFHKGHTQTVASMHNPVVAIVKGAKTSQDKKNNPLTFEEQKGLILKVFPDLTVIEVKSGYVPQIIEDLKASGRDVKRIFAGADRFDDYKRQISDYNKSNQSEKITVKFVEPLRITSATYVREAIIRDDYKVYSTLMPKELCTIPTFLSLQKKINRGQV